VKYNRNIRETEQKHYTHKLKQKMHGVRKNGAAQIRQRPALKLNT